jgi:hypothetical protein
MRRLERLVEEMVQRTMLLYLEENGKAGEADAPQRFWWSIRAGEGEAAIIA